MNDTDSDSNNSDHAIADISSGSSERIEERHRRELKALRAEIQAIKKSATKGDKRKRKEVNEQIARMEQEIEERHKRELADHADAALVENSKISLNGGGSDTAPSLSLGMANVSLTESTIEHSPSLLQKKPNKQQQRKLKKQQELEERRREAEQKFKNRPDPKAIEEAGIKRVLEENNLRIYEILPDGHCLYNAVGHQLKITGVGLMDFKELRQAAAKQMLEHCEDYMPFLTNETGDDMIIQQQSYEKYCDQVANTAEWGGQLEVRALSEALRRPIYIYQSDSPVLKLGEQYSSEPPLRLSYHRFAYGLGEHYNSLLPALGSDTS